VGKINRRREQCQVSAGPFQRLDRRPAKKRQGRPGVPKGLAPAQGYMIELRRFKARDSYTPQSLFAKVVAWASCP
jgi:hypothetical protein